MLAKPEFLPVMTPRHARSGVESSSSGMNPVPIRVATVDSMQGDESDIILLSLVRCNAECNPGFVREAERMCVALSRARDVLIILGNTPTVTSYGTPFGRKTVPLTPDKITNAAELYEKLEAIKPPIPPAPTLRDEDSGPDGDFM